MANAPQQDSPGHAQRNSTVTLVAVSLLLVLYVGAYYALARPMLVAISPSTSPIASRSGWIQIAPAYAPLPSWLSHQLVTVLFRPIHTVDRWVRPDYWKVVPFPPATPVAPPPLTIPGASGPIVAP